MAKALRVDYSAAQLEAPSVLTDGSVKIPALIARTGVQEYSLSDGRIVREYRPPEEVFAEDSLASWDDLALTIDHPSEPVQPSNWSTLAKGHVDDPSKDPSGEFLKATIVVKDAATIQAIDAKELIELSCGYFVDIDPTSGVSPKGEAYDQIQRNIIGNHVALLPKDMGRAGNDVRVYTGDSKATPRGVALRTESKSKGYTTDMATLEETPKVTEVKVIPLDEYTKVCAERDAAIARAASAESSATAAVAAADSKLAARVALRANALKIDSKINVGTPDDLAVMCAAVKACDPTFVTDGKDETYMRTVFDLACQGKLGGGVPARTQANALERVVNDSVESRDDGNGSLADAARQRMLDRQRAQSAGKGRK